MSVDGGNIVKDPTQRTVDRLEAAIKESVEWTGCNGDNAIAYAILAVAFAIQARDES